MFTARPPANPTIQPLTNSVGLRLTFLFPTNRNPLSLFAPNSNFRNNSLSFARCSTKPDTGEDCAKKSKFPDESPSNAYPSKPSSNEGASPPSISSSSRGLVFDLGHNNSWDSAEIGSPVVKRFISDEEERWYMWYYGKSGANPSDSVGLAISSNGVHWERGSGPVTTSEEAGLVMTCSEDWWAFDTVSVRPAEVLVMSSNKVRTSSAVYWQYYTGYISEMTNFSDDSLDFDLGNPETFLLTDSAGSCRNNGVGKIFKSLPGLAISQDGRYWARIEGEHHSGALFDVGKEGEWDALFIAGPQVVFHGNGDLRMYYHSFDMENKHFGIGIARSRDGIKWVKLGKIIGAGKAGSFDEFGALNACVVKYEEKYVMAYEGVAGDGKRRIGMAISPDGLKDWRRWKEEAVLEASMAGGWDEGGVGMPCLVQMEGEEDEWRLYYRGVGHGGRSGIGMAVSEGNDIGSMRRWNGFNPL